MEVVLGEVIEKEFVLRLPDKLRSGDLDPESETFGLDHFTISSLTKGLCVCVCVCVCVWFINKMQEKNKKKMVYACMCIICTLHRNVHTIEETSLIAI